MMIENQKSKSSQKKITIITVIGIAGVIVAILSSGGGKKSTKNDLSKIIDDSKKKINLLDPNHGIKAEDRWLENAENKLDDYDKFQKGYAQDKNNIESKLDDLEKKYEDAVLNQTGLIESQGREIENLKKQLENNKSLAAGGKQDPFAPGGAGQSVAPISKGIQTTVFDLEKVSVTQGDFFHPSEYVPAGAYAAATIISGVDAPVGSTAQTDPRPILIRINGFAYSSSHEGDVQQADLRGCVITGASWGDLPSEKVYVKLVNMTCSKSEDLIYETAVKGYVAGQGKTGVRGDVIAREGDFLSKSFLAGLVGGFGQGLSARVAPPLSFSTGVTLQNGYSNEDVLKKGAGQGVSSASNRLADYYINRAEQYQPVISIPSGIDVNVVFVEGFTLNGKRRRAPTPLNNSQFLQKNFNP